MQVENGELCFGQGSPWDQGRGGTPIARGSCPYSRGMNPAQVGATPARDRPPKESPGFMCTTPGKPPSQSEFASYPYNIRWVKSDKELKALLPCAFEDLGDYGVPQTML